MGRALVILVLSYTYVGCAARVPPPSHPLRIAAGSGAERAAIGRGAARAGEGRLRPLDGRPERTFGAAGCASFRVVGAPDPDDVRRAWEDRASDPLRACLLEPVHHVEARSASLVVCTDRAVPDWWERVRHPALGAAAPVRDGLDVLPAAGDPVARVAAGEADLAVAYGASAAAAQARGDVRAARAPGWDRTYALWIPVRDRWLADPRFREWVAAVLDPDAMAEIVFDGAAEPARGLVATEQAERGVEPSRRPFGPGSEPRLSLRFDEDDAGAAAVASRVRAVLGDAGVRVTLDPRPATRVGGELASDRHAMALVAHRPPVADPLLALLDTLCPMGESAAGPVSEIAQATREAGSRARAARAAAIERELVRSARLVPLVRLPAWLVTAPALRGVRAGAWGEIDVERAAWRR
jgi:hypothetical protein